MDPFEQQRDQAIANQLKHHLNNKMNSEFSAHIRSNPDPEAIKLHFQIPGKQNTFHQFVWPRRGFLSLTRAQTVLKEIGEKVDSKLAPTISYVYYSDPKENSALDDQQQ